MPVKLCNLSKSECLLDKNDYQAAMDLENQYFHVRINPVHQKYLGCKAINPVTGELTYFVFCVMIYGCKPAAAIVTRLTYPVVKYLHGLGVKFSIYMDDGRTVASSYELTKEQHMLVQENFQKAGWNIQFKKTTLEPTQQLYHQGFICNTEKMEYSLPKFKIKHLKECIQDLVSKDQVSARFLARVIAKLTASERALGPIVRIMLRSGHVLLDSAVRKNGWDTLLKVTEAVESDFKFIIENLDSENGQPIVNYKTGVTLNMLLRK